MNPLPDMPNKGIFFFWLLVAAAVLAADQASKSVILAYFRHGEQLPLTGFFNLTLVYNTGASFGLLANMGGWQRWLFTLLALGICLWILVMLWKHPRQRLQNTALALIMGGALGNVIDRLLHGAVVDFLDFHLAGWHWPAFNLADSGITAGAALLILGALLEQREVKA
ncbi:MAG: signal peptidase II [Zoogloeaceae bacterium]|jgi:signal peptidase II|nr:signal peptidase II [Zoogloeaceae bacterium]